MTRLRQVGRNLSLERLQNFIPETAQVLKGPPWASEYFTQREKLEMSMNMSMSSNTNLIMELVGDKVIHRYQFQDFQGIAPIYAQWDVVIETKCHRFKVLSQNFYYSPSQEFKDLKMSGVIEFENDGRNMTFPYHSANFTDPSVLMTPLNSRWIQRFINDYGPNGFINNNICE